MDWQTILFLCLKEVRIDFSVLMVLWMDTVWFTIFYQLPYARGLCVSFNELTVC